MKWLSIDKYLPNGSEIVFIRAQYKLDHYERYFVGSIDVLENIKDLVAWELYPAKYLDIKLQDYYVTHFAQIDPVEIEELGCFK